MILAGFTFMGIVVYQRATGSGPFANLGRSASEPAASVPVATGPMVGKVALGLPPGARIESITGLGGRVALLVRGASGNQGSGDQVMVVDPGTGAVATILP